jgi:surface polysaccharide O-acyltransferase-like enzyme
MRLKRIDLFRLIAIYIVIWAHSQFFDGITPTTPLTKGIELATSIVLRFAMPFFFLASGYFTGGRIAREPENALRLAWKATKRLLLIFVVWSLVYAIEAPETALQLAREHPLTLLFEGTRIHLWFLVSITLTIWLFALWPLDKKGHSFLVFGGLVFILGLLGGSYFYTPIGLNLHFDTRDGIFFSTLFFAVGVLTSLKPPKVSAGMAWGIFLVGLALFCLEAYVLWANWKILPIRHDYLLSSIPYGIGAFLIALTPKKETQLDARLAPYAQYVLGIYVSHLLVLDLLKPLGALMNPILWAFLLPALIFAIALTGVYLLSKTPLRNIVI